MQAKKIQAHTMKVILVNFLTSPPLAPLYDTRQSTSHLYFLII